MEALIRRIIPNGGLLSEAQEKAMVTIYTSTKNVFVDLRCGEGKTLAYSLPLSLAPRGSVVLVIVPYVALVESTLSALNGYGFQATNFDKTGQRFQPESFHNGVRTVHDQVEFVVAVSDTAAADGMMAFTKGALRAGRLARIVMDEAHQIVLSGTFRQVMNRIPMYGSFRVPVIFVSGTLPTCVRRSLLDSFGLADGRTIAVSSDRTVSPTRRNVSFVSLETTDDPVKAGKQVIKDWLNEHSDDLSRRVLVFVLTLEMVATMKKAIEDCNAGTVMEMTAQTSSEARRAFKEAYRSGQRVFGVCTSVVAEGMDLAGVELVVVVGGAHQGISSVYQMACRGGRGVGGGESLTTVVLLFQKSAGFKTRVGIALDSVETLTDRFSAADRPGAKKLFTYDCIGNVFAKKYNKVCGDNVLEGMMRETLPLELQEERGPCGGCRGCDNADWIRRSFTSDLADMDVEEDDDAAEAPEESEDEQANDPVSDHDEEWELEINAREAIQLTAGSACLFCGNDIVEQGQAVHRPNNCAEHKPAIPKRSCYSCFGTGHTGADIQKFLKNTPGNGDRKSSKVFNDCAFIYGEHEKAADPTTLKVCIKCWLHHGDAGEFVSSEDCQGLQKWSVMQSAFLYIFHNTERRKDFYDSLPEHVRPGPNVFNNWRSFKEWGVYGRGVRTQNALRVLTFAVETRRKKGL